MKKKKAKYISLPFVRECLPGKTEDELRAAEDVVVEFYTAILRIGKEQYLSRQQKFEDRHALTENDSPTTLEDTRDNHTN